MLTRAIIAVGGVLAMAMPLPLSAEPSPGAADGCIEWDFTTQECLEYSEGTDEEDLTIDGEQWKPATEVNGVPCYYVGVANPQPYPYESVWDGHRDEQGNPTGIILNCAYAPSGREYRWRYWSPAPPGGAAPDPAALAERAADQLDLRPIEIGIAPHPADTGAVGYIGLPVWGWTANPDDAVLGPQTAQVTEGPFTVTVTAEVDELIWDWGDGITTRCTPPGTPYSEDIGFAESPDCGHEGYAEQGDKHVTVTATWRITWEGMGGEDELDAREVTSSTDITVGELQVLRR